MGDAVVHGLLDSKHDLNWDEDQVDANNDLTFGDGAVEDDWRTNHTKISGLMEGDDVLVHSMENLTVDKKPTEYEDPAIVSLQKTSLKPQPPGFYASAPESNRIPQDIWGTPAPAAPIQPPPGFGAPPGFGSVISQPEQGDGLRSSLMIDSSMPLSVEDLERQQHFQRKVIEDSYSENGLRGGGISAPIGPPPSRQADQRQSESGGIQDDPAVLATRIDTTGMQSPVTRRDEPVGTNQLHPQHRQMLRNNQKNNNRNNRNNQNRRQRDPYANLMSKREREWITSMQLRALEIKDPEVDDYYYVNYMKRLLKKGQNVENQQLVTPAPKEPRRNRKNSEKGEKDEKSKEEKDKEPKKGWSEGSLGKPISSSVHNPRRMIAMITREPDANAAPSEENTESELAKYMSKKNLFKSIEAAYTVLLDLELMVQDELRSFGKEAKKVDELLTLVQPNDQMRLLSILSIRKGKRLIQRILPHLNQESSIQILNCFINNLALITKRDIEDDVLPELYDVLANILNALDLEQVADLASRKRYNNLQNIAKSRFGASIICKLLDRGQVLLSQMSIQEFPADARQAWLDLVKTLTRDIATVALSAEGLPPLLGVYPSLAKAFERSRSQRHLINHLNGNYKKIQNNFNY